MSVRFTRMNRRWVAMIFVDENTCTSWQTVGTRRNMNRIIRTQLDPQGISYTVDEY